jgi:hypothetical protein
VDTADRAECVDDAETREIQDLMEPREFSDHQVMTDAEDDREPRGQLVLLVSKVSMDEGDHLDPEGEQVKMDSQDLQDHQDHLDHQEQQYHTQLHRPRSKDLFTTTMLTTIMAMARVDRAPEEQLIRTTLMGHKTS